MSADPSNWACGTCGSEDVCLPDCPASRYRFGRALTAAKQADAKPSGSPLGTGRHWPADFADGIRCSICRKRLMTSAAQLWEMCPGDPPPEPKALTLEQGAEAIAWLKEQPWTGHGLEVLVDIDAYTRGGGECWCGVLRVAPGATPYPVKVQIPNKGTGQYASAEIKGFRHTDSSTLVTAARDVHRRMGSAYPPWWDVA